MKPTIFRKHILQQNVQMDGSINFQTNGDINVYPCPWESDKEVTNGSRVRYRAGIEVDADGWPPARLTLYGLITNNKGGLQIWRIK